MEIACPQCSMKYALDPRLLPPGGVPVQCTRCGHVFVAGASEPAPASKPASAPARVPNPLNSTLMYGANGKGPDAPGPQGTQTFGAVPAVPQVPPRVAPLVPRVQPAPPAAQPPGQRTQAFGAVPQVPPAARPPPAAKPTQVTPSTQAFGAVPLSPPAAPRPAAPRPVSVAVPLPPPPTTPSADPFAAWEAPALAVSSPPGDAPSGGSPAQPPGMVPRGGASERSPREPSPVAAPRGFDLEPRIGVAATTPIELPDEILVQLDRPLSELMGEEEPAAPAPPPPGATPTLSKPLELPPELLDRPGPPPRELDPEARAAKGNKARTGRNLLIAGGVLVLALTAFLTSPAWRSRSDVLPHPVQAARDEAVAKLRRDDTASKEDALAELKALLAAHPQSVELQAELGIALALHLDDTQTQLATLRAKEKGLTEAIERLTTDQTPIDWQSRVNTRREELSGVHKDVFFLEERVQTLSRDTLRMLKTLETAPPKEAREPALARLRAQALVNAVLGTEGTPGLAVKLAQTELPEWSALTMAEYTLQQTSPSATQSGEAAAAMERMRANNSTHLRAYMLGARLALLRHEPAAAQALLDTVITLNPKHELARQLHGYLQALKEQAAEPPPPVRPPPTPTPEPAPESAPAPTNDAAPASPPEGKAEPARGGG